MTIIDIIILITIGSGVVMGFAKGFIRQLTSIVGLVVGLLAARALYMPLAEKLHPTLTESITLAQALSFIVIWLAVPLLFSAIASILTRAVDAISLGWLNRWLGGALGAVKYLLISSLVIWVIEFIDCDNQLIKQTKKSSSLLYYPMETFAGVFMPTAKQITQQYILNTQCNKKNPINM